MKFWSRYEPKSDKEELYLLLEKVFQVVKYKIEIGDVETANILMNDIADYFYKMYSLKETNSLKYHRLFYNKFIYEQYLKTKKLLLFNSIEPNEGDFFFEIFYKIWESATQKGETDLAYRATYLLYQFLSFLSKEKEVNNHISTILNYFEKIIRSGLRVNSAALLYNFRLPLYEWYLHLWFSQKIQLEYEVDFERKLFQLFKISIDNNQEELFSDFIKSIISQVGNPSIMLLEEVLVLPTIGVNNERAEKLRSLNMEYRQIQPKLRNVFSAKIFNEEKEKLEHFEKKVRECFSSKEAEALNLENRLIGVYESFTRCYKVNNFRGLVMFLCSYVLFREKYSWIYNVLYYNRPKDADALWMNPDVFPRSYPELLSIFINKDYVERKLHFLWEGHHGSQIYVLDFFLIYLIYCIPRRVPTEDDVIFEEHYLQDFSIKEVFFLRDNLPNLRSRVSEFSNNLELKKALGWVNIDLESVLNKLLDRILKSVDTYITNYLVNSVPDQELLNEFKSDFIAQFNNRAILRNIIRYFGSSEMKDMFVDPPHSISVQSIIDKAQFIKEWNVSYFGTESTYSSELARFENNTLIFKIRNQCTKTEKSLDQLLDSEDINPNNYFILGMDINPVPHLVENYSSSDFRYHDIPNLKPLGYLGNYKEDLQVFSFRRNFGYPYMMLISKNSFGKLLQYNPVQLEENLPFIEDVSDNRLFYRLEFYSENQTYRNEVLANEPDWLNNFEDRETELMKRAFLKVWLKSDFEPDENFSGFLIELNQNRLIANEEE